MVRYRKLTMEELESMEKEFIDFLVINGIAADDWIKLKETEPQKADSIVDEFSNVVFESVLRKAGYLDYVSEKVITCFQALEKKMVMVVLELPNDSIIDLTSQSLNETDPSIIKGARVYTTEKSYQSKREGELFKLIQKGASISDGTLFKKLCLLL